MDGLPFRDGIFDVVIAELGLTSRVSAESAVSEMVRVAKPGASVVLVQPVWKAPVDSVRREILGQHLGCRPMMVVEWKRLLRDAGVEGLRTEDWSDEETAFGPRSRNRFPTSVSCSRLRRSWGSLAGPGRAGAGLPSRRS